jgi:hypothetical protein
VPEVRGGHAGEPRHDRAETAERQRQVEALADEYLEGLLSRQAPDRQAFLAARADVAELLEPRLALLELMHREARPADGITVHGSRVTSLQKAECHGAGETWSPP